MTWEPDPDNILGVRVTASGAPQIRIDWGDGTQPVLVAPGVQTGHLYAATGTYTVTASAPGHTSGQHVVVVKDHAPVAYVFTDADDDWRALLWVDEPPNGEFDIDWGDGQFHVITRDPPPYPRVPHDYTAAGTYTLTVTDKATKRTTVMTFDVGGLGGIFQFPTDRHKPLIRVQHLATEAEYELDWGDGSAVVTGEVPATGVVTQTRATNMAEGEYTVTMKEKINGTERRTFTRKLTVPNQFDLTLDLWVSWPREHEAISPDPLDTTQRVTVEARGASAECLIDWGDGSPTSTVAPQSTAFHDYTVPLPATGVILKVTEQGTTPDMQRIYTRRLADPTFVAEPVLSALSAGTVVMNVRGVPDDWNLDWYRIDWGDGNIVRIGAAGRDYPASHTYIGSNVYSIVVDAPGQYDAVRRQVKIATYPAPRITLSEDTSDTTRMTVTCTVNNADCGGPVSVRWGDGSAAIEIADGASASHQYASEATYSVVGECVADRTAKVRSQVSVPYGPSSTLQAAVEQNGTGDPYSAKLTITQWDVNKDVEYSWGEDATFVPWTPGEIVTNDYGFDGDYTVTVRYVDLSEALDIPITIPFGG